jgi:DNA-binding NtrC family response regulator
MAMNPQTAAHKILIIDDEKIESGVLESILADAGFEAFAISGRAALPSNKDACSVFDLVIVDVTAGTPSDSEELREVREAMPGISVLLMTDNGSIQNVLQSLSETDFGIEYLKKPFSKDEFLVAVNRTVRRAQVLRTNC